MNAVHHWICSSAKWQKKLEDQMLPWALQQTPLGPDLLEIGPGPGLTTDLLRRRADRVTALELDSGLAASLGIRFARTNVRIIRADATAIPFADASFSAVASFTMLHHLPSAEMQDRLFGEVYRVLRPGSPFLGIDSMNSLLMRLLHIRDTLVPLDPQTLPMRLERCGFQHIKVQRESRSFRFEAYRA